MKRLKNTRAEHNNQRVKVNMKAELLRVFRYMESYRIPVITAMIMAVVGVIMIIIGPKKIGDITDIMSAGVMPGASGSAPEIDMQAIAKVGITLAAIYVIGAVSTFIQHYIMATVTVKTAKRMRGEISRKINCIPQSYFNRTPQGDILSRVTNDVSTLQQGLSNSLPTTVTALVQFFGCLIMMFVTEWRMALCLVLVTFLGLFALLALVSHSQKYFIAKQESLGKLNGYIEEMYSGHAVVRSSRAADKVKAEFAELNADVYEANWKSRFFSGVMQPLMTAVGNLGYVAVCVTGSLLALSNPSFGFGKIVSFIFYVHLFTAPLGQLAGGVSNLQTAAASAHRIFEFLNEQELPDESGKSLKIGDVKGEVEFKNVRFSYPDNPQKTVIKDFSAHIRPGQKVAIVGPTGAGKTTLVNLLMRFFETSGGNIMIDGVNIADITSEELHGLFGMVLQDTWLFEGTFRENLVYNLKGVSDEKLMEVLKACGLDHFVKTLPDGLDSVISEGMSISAGQRQLITIARAMVQNNSMLILDEATSSVDTRTELRIQRAMDRLSSGKTSFVIAHRLSTIRNADLILVMNEGDIVESGTHETLMGKNGFYADLYNSQFDTAEAA